MPRSSSEAFTKTGDAVRRPREAPRSASLEGRNRCDRLQEGNERNILCTSYSNELYDNLVSDYRLYLQFNGSRMWICLVNICCRLLVVSTGLDTNVWFKVANTHGNTMSIFQLVQQRNSTWNNLSLKKVQESKQLRCSGLSPQTRMKCLP